MVTQGDMPPSRTVISLFMTPGALFAGHLVPLLQRWLSLKMMAGLLSIAHLGLLEHRNPVFPAAWSIPLAMSVQAPAGQACWAQVHVSFRQTVTLNF
jgi:hypothetical protein